MTGLNFSKNAQIALVFIVGISLLGLSYGRIRSTSHAPVRQSKVSIVSSGEVETDAPAVTPLRSTDKTRDVVVHVAGCVKKPSVYHLSPDSRVVDAIHLAGGPTADANLDAVNLAAIVKDGTQIMVPSRKASITTTPNIGKPIDNSHTVSRASASGSSCGSASQGSVNINTAGLDELDQLPGVGPATAQKIIDYRNQIGQFTSIDQLENVKGIGPKKLEQMRPYIQL